MGRCGAFPSQQKSLPVVLNARSPFTVAGAAEAWGTGPFLIPDAAKSRNDLTNTMLPLFDREAGFRSRPIPTPIGPSAAQQTFDFAGG